MSEFFALLRAFLSLSGPSEPGVPVIPWVCCLPRPRPVVVVVIFVVVLTAMVILTVAGVDIVTATAVVLACGGLTVAILLRLFGPGSETA